MSCRPLGKERAVYKLGRSRSSRSSQRTRMESEWIRWVRREEEDTEEDEDEEDENEEEGERERRSRREREEESSDAITGRGPFLSSAVLRRRELRDQCLLSSSHFPCRELFLLSDLR